MQVQSSNDGTQTIDVATLSTSDTGVVVPFNAPGTSSFEQVLASVAPAATAGVAEPAAAPQSQPATSGYRVPGTLWVRWGAAAGAGLSGSGQAAGQGPAMWPAVTVPFSTPQGAMWPQVVTTFPTQSGAAWPTATTPFPAQAGPAWPAAGYPPGVPFPSQTWPTVTAPFPAQAASPGSEGGQPTSQPGAAGAVSSPYPAGYATMPAYLMPMVMIMPVMGMAGDPLGGWRGAMAQGAVPYSARITQGSAPAGTAGIGGGLPMQGQTTDTTGMRLPFAGTPNITQPYGPTSYAAEPAYKGYSHFHTGIDFALPTGTPIDAAGSGKVVAAGWDSTGYGNRVLIDHGNGQYTLYGHLDQVTCRPGDWVQSGSQIGLSGSTGNSSGPHLHFGVEINGEWVDPAPYLFQGGGAAPQPLTADPGTAPSPSAGQDPAQGSGGNSQPAAASSIFGAAPAAEYRVPAGWGAPASGDNPAGKRAGASNLPPDLPIFRHTTPHPAPGTRGAGYPPGAAASAYTPAITRSRDLPVFSPARSTTAGAGDPLGGWRSGSGRSSPGGAGLPADLPIFSPASAVGGGSPATQTGAISTSLDALIQQVAQRTGVPAGLLAAMVQAESSGDPNAVSTSGAKGLMQLMDGTAAQYGVADSFDPQQNLTGGAMFIRDLLTQFGGNERLAVAAYNAGPTTVRRYGGVPPYPETQQYVQRVMNLEQQYAGRFAAPAS